MSDGKNWTETELDLNSTPPVLAKVSFQFAIQTRKERQLGPTERGRVVRVVPTVASNPGSALRNRVYSFMWGGPNR